jgi:hypothetical protein
MGMGPHFSPPYNCREPGGRNEAAHRFASVAIGLVLAVFHKGRGAGGTVGFPYMGHSKSSTKTYCTLPFFDSAGYTGPTTLERTKRHEVEPASIGGDLSSRHILIYGGFD